MDRSTLRLPDPDAPLPNRERRRTVRQRLHTPVYVSFSTPQSGAIIDLSELLDLHEHGFAVQTAIPSGLPRGERLEVNRAVTMCLDLPETRQFVHCSGQVMWTDDTGRAGIRFSFLPDRSRQALKEWLFANLLVASTNHAARVNQLVQRRREAGTAELTSQAGRVPEPDLSEQRAPSSAHHEQHALSQSPLQRIYGESTTMRLCQWLIRHPTSRTQEQIESTSALTDPAELPSCARPCGVTFRARRRPEANQGYPKSRDPGSHERSARARCSATHHRARREPYRRFGRCARASLQESR